MEYRNDISMASLHNVLHALNEGGMVSCMEISMRVWNNASGEQQARKIEAPRNTSNHYEAYAHKQIRQEVRRTLNDYFSEQDDSHLEINRAHAYGDVERFWIDYPQDIDVAPDSIPVDEDDEEIESFVRAILMEGMEPCSGSDVYLRLNRILSTLGVDECLV